MAKGGFRGGYGAYGKRPAPKAPMSGMGGGMNMDMIKRAQQLQQEMMDLQKGVEEREFNASVGGGMIKAVASGKKELVSIEIDPEAVDPDDVEMLQDMIVAAVNEALRQVDEELNNVMNKYAGGMGLPM